MFGTLARVLGFVSVRETSGIVEVTGVPAEVIARHIAKVYSTKRITTNMFTRIWRSGFAFPSFFAVEVHYMLKDARLDAKTWSMKHSLDRIIEGLEEKTWLKSTMGPVKSMVDLSLLKNLKWKAKPHQIEFLKTYGDMVPRYHLRGYYLGSSPGTGKTFMDLALAATVIPRDIAEVKIIISPLNAIHTVWQETIVELFHKAPNYWMSSTPGPAPVDRKTEYFIFHYESLNRAVMLCRQFAARGVKFFVIIDESHNFNEITSNRTIELVSLLSKLQYKPFNVWASGSPFKAMGKEAIPFLRSNDPLFTPDVEARFKKIFGGDNLKAMDILGHRLGLITFKTSKDTVMSGEKPLIYRRMVKASDEEARPFLIETIREEMRDFIVERVRYYQSQLDTYTDLFNSLVELHRKSLPNTRIALDRYKRYVWVIDQLRKAQAHGKRPPVEYLQETKAYETTYLIPSLPAGARKQFRKCQSVVKSLKLKVRGEAMGRILIPRRAQCAAFLGRECRLPEIIKESESKTLVFSSAVSVILDTAEYLKGEGFLPEVVYQKTNKFLTEIIKRFRDDPNVNPVCATFQSLSTAVPMIMASTLVMLNLPFRQYVYDQTISRVYRLGQPYQVRIFEVLLDTGDQPNVSTRAMDIIAWCREQLDVLLGGEFSGPEDDDIIFEKILKTT